MEMEGNPSAMRPWAADLPQPLMEVILDLLPLIDYIRFASVCKSWQSIHREHRPRHPKHHRLPWFLPHRLHRLRPHEDEEEGGGFLESCSPLEKKHYRLPLPPDLRRSRDVFCYASCGGWLLITLEDLSSADFIMETLLFNPVTRSTIPLPCLSTIPVHTILRGALSAPPTDPECTVLIVDGHGSIFLHRYLRDGRFSGWMRVGPASYPEACSATACGGKFYCHYRNRGDVGVIDPLLPQPALRWLISLPELHPRLCCILMDNDGDAFIVWLKLDAGTIKEIRVFRVDQSREELVRVETLGDRAIFVGSPCFINSHIFANRCFAFSFIAAELSLKKNTIYCSQYNSWSNDGLCRWRAFHLDSESWVDGTEVSCTYLKDGWRRHPWPDRWFLPTLDWVDTMQAGL